MFVDYYAVLGIKLHADQSAIKIAFKNQAIKWHPDKNLGFDTTKRMQQINEAYLILKDSEARRLYDIEYLIYHNQLNSSQKHSTPKYNYSDSDNTEDSSKKDADFEDSNYDVIDQTLKKWMSNARIQAKQLAKQTIEDFRGMSKAGGNAFVEAALQGLFRYLFVGLVILVLLKMCKS